MALFVIQARNFSFSSSFIFIYCAIKNTTFYWCRETRNGGTFNFISITYDGKVAKFIKILSTRFYFMITIVKKE